MEAVWAGLIALASAVIVKVLDYIFSRNDKTTKTLNEIKSDIGSVRKELSRVLPSISQDSTTKVLTIS